MLIILLHHEIQPLIDSNMAMVQSTFDSPPLIEFKFISDNTETHELWLVEGYGSQVG